eukprot:TRINITY_DN15239_c0_g1_i1.p1 TRINITY_DN15239_c0_g1~~TRINITY_DN15239_c0_g1_i1.p1  ORF type:complete len:462 (+),score=82.39 TRINITY_DN15239_c0_g1_i1:11-1396(+)
METKTANKAHMPKAMSAPGSTPPGGAALRPHEPKALNVTKEHGVFLVELCWNVGKANDSSIDMDASCLLFDKWGRWVETIFWDNLQTKGVDHKGDEVLQATGDDYDDIPEDAPKTVTQQDEKETIRVDFWKLDPNVSTLVFAMNVFTKDKSFASLGKVLMNVYRETPGGCAPVYKYTINTSDLKTMKANALVIGKVYRHIKKEVEAPKQEHSKKRKSISFSRKRRKSRTNDTAPSGGGKPEWMVEALLKDATTTLQPGGTVDDMIPLLFKKQLVTPLVATWESITLTLIGARSLAPRDLSGKSDPYVVITTGEDVLRSSTITSTLDPNWNETFTIKYRDDRTKICFDLFDWDRIGKDEFLGHFSIDVKLLPPNLEIDRWFPLSYEPSKATTRGARVTGSVHMKILKSVVIPYYLQVGSTAAAKTRNSMYIKGGGTMASANQGGDTAEASIGTSVTLLKEEK